MSEIAGISFFNFYFDPPRKETIKDNRKNLKEGFVYPSTTKEKCEKKVFQRHPYQEVNLCLEG